ncbi:transposase [Azospirillum sp. OGB3]|nr:transposase [Azospirillum sp. OGB3]
MFVDTLLAMRDLARRFAALVRKQGTGTLDDWMAATARTWLEGFASGLQKDLAAVRAALETPWSAGPIEGRINRLKTVKRTMYGRAGFELLRSRTLDAA